MKCLALLALIGPLTVYSAPTIGGLIKREAIAKPGAEAAPTPQNYGEYGTYSDYPSAPAAPEGNYGEYGTYSDYPSSYADYGTYRREVNAQPEVDPAPTSSKREDVPEVDEEAAH